VADDRRRASRHSTCCDLRIMYLTHTRRRRHPPHSLRDGATILKEPFTIDQLRSAVVAVRNGAHQAARGT
jgi:hypothetical protein